jgi:hypothetical protein
LGMVVDACMANKSLQLSPGTTLGKQSLLAEIGPSLRCSGRRRN